MIKKINFQFNTEADVFVLLDHLYIILIIYNCINNNNNNNNNHILVTIFERTI